MSNVSIKVLLNWQNKDADFGGDRQQIDFEVIDGITGATVYVQYDNELGCCPCYLMRISINKTRYV